MQSRAASLTTLDKLDPSLTGRIRISTMICYASSYARPGGNITGVASAPMEVQGKTVQVLTEAIPGFSRVAILWSSANPAHTLMVREAQEAAQGLGLQTQLLDVREASELDGAFA